MTRLKIHYFAWMREQIGVAEDHIELPAEVRTAAELIDWLSASSANHAAAFADRSKIRCAIDQIMVPLDSSVDNAREVAFFPPVTGG
jgi:sulfur-carrier protein